MKLKDQPITPCMMQQVGENQYRLHKPSDGNSYNSPQMGLTKREYFVAKAMQGLLSNPEWMKVYQKEKYLMQSQIVAEVATSMADECLKILSIEEVTEQ
jgi:fructosamine-3-kinase